MLNAYIIVASIFAFLSIFLGVYVLAPAQRKLEKAEYVPLIHRGQLGSRREELKELYPLYRILLPFIAYLGFFISKLPIERYRNRLKAKLVSAGNPGAFTPDEFTAIRIYSFIFLPIIVYGILSLFFTSIHPIVIVIAALVGLLYPSMWLHDAILRRAKKINRALPYTLDLLTLSIEAGLDFISSVERIVTKKESKGPLAEELFQMLQELKMGKTRREALRDMARRINIDSVNSVVAALIQADQLGTSLGPVLRIQSDMFRVKRSQMAEKLAMEAPVKLLGPLVLIFIAVFLLLLGPTFIRLIRGEFF